MFKKKKRVERVLVLGLGGIGSYLGKRLVHEGYAVTVIESQRETLQQADGKLDARLIRGNAMSVACWQEADARDMDLLIAVTDNDAVNMVASMIGHRFGILRKIARVRSLEFGDQNGNFSNQDLRADLLTILGSARRQQPPLQARRRQHPEDRRARLRAHPRNDDPEAAGDRVGSA